MYVVGASSECDEERLLHSIHSDPLRSGLAFFALIVAGLLGKPGS
jgi:hypothetical protein